MIDKKTASLLSFTLKTTDRKQDYFCLKIIPYEFIFTEPIKWYTYKNTDNDIYSKKFILIMNQKMIKKHVSQ